MPQEYEIRVWADFYNSKVKAIPISIELRARIPSANSPV
jgi:hypothetical protein